MARNHPLIEDAARGILPKWSRVSRSRRDHMDRVAELMSVWSEGLGLKKKERRRWIAAGLLHDAMKGARARDMRRLLPDEFDELPVPILHGPAAAAKLEKAGVEDRSVLNAIAFHTLGHPSLDELGRALYAADFLEPGRSLKPKLRARLTKRMPADLDAVVTEIVGARMKYQMKRGRTLRPETVAFWNELNGGARWDHVSAEY